MADISPEDLDRLAIGATRYALGRMTYVVGDTCSVLRRVWPDLTDHARSVILRDLREEIERDDRAREAGDRFRPLGHDCDRAEWVGLLEWVEVRDAR